MEENAQQQPWRGYTLDELRVKRLVNLTRIELEQARLNNITEKFSSKSSFKSQLPLIGKMFNALDYVDYAVLAYRIGRKAFGLFRRGRK